MMYQIMKDGKPYGKKSQSEVYLDSKLASLKAQYINNEWTIKEVRK